MGHIATGARAEDGYERYYTEKIWSWIPEIHRTEDEATGGALRALVESLAVQVAVARRSIDRLWDDSFVEAADDWAIPYIGQLVGTRMVHELNRRGRRVDVARTIFYRRRKGTPLVLELLVRDIAGWDGALVEAFRRLARARHRLDPEPAARRGRVTGTPPGGFADLRSPRVSDLIDGPFDELSHTADPRRLRGHLGRVNIPKLNLHLYRLMPLAVRLATPADFAGGRFTFDPSGRDVPLFAPARRSSEDCRPALEWEVPAPIRCRLLNDAAFALTAEIVDALPLGPDAARELGTWVGQRFRHEPRLRETVASMQHGAAIEPHLDEILRDAITADSPKRHLYPGAVAVGEPAIVPRQRVIAANLDAWSAGVSFPPGKTVAIDPEHGRFLFLTPPDGTVEVPIYHPAVTGRVGAATYDRRESVVETGVTPFATTAVTIPPDGNHELPTSLTYHADGDVAGVRNLLLQAANPQRPYLVRAATPPNWTFTAAGPGPAPPERTLTLEGIWLGVIDPSAAPTPPPCGPVAAELRLAGAWDRVTIRHSTLDPGGERAHPSGGECQAIPYVRIVALGPIEELVIERSIVGPITERGPHARIEKIIARDSILHSLDPAVPAIETALGEADLQRVTIFGDVHVNRLFASEALVQGRVFVTDNQHGCFRFGAAHGGSILPPAFHSPPFDDGIPDHVFVSRRFGDPGYAQLSSRAPASLARGAENRSEIGAYSADLAPLRRDDLAAKLEEFAPFGTILQLIEET